MKTSPRGPWRNDSAGHDDLTTTVEIDHPLAAYGYELPEPPVEEPVRKSRTAWRWVRRVAYVVVLLVTVMCAGIYSLRWYTPDESAFMRAHDGPVIYEWVDLNNISRYVIAAAIAAEDPEFVNRTAAFDFEDFLGRVQTKLKGERDDGGSTIPQQLAKNMFLYEGESVIRKGIEAILATPTALTLSKGRQMELYLNYAQTGPDLFGVCTGSWYYFGSAPWDLTPHQAAQLVGLYPLPSEARRTDAPGGGIYMVGPNGTLKFNEQVERGLGGVDYMGGYEVIMEKIGIEGDASDYSAEREKTASCSTMPADVEELLKKGG